MPIIHGQSPTEVRTRAVETECVGSVRRPALLKDLVDIQAQAALLLLR